MHSKTQKLGYQDLYVSSRGPMAKPASTLAGKKSAVFNLTFDVSFLFPYINAVANKAELYEKPSFIRFMFNDVFCVLYPERCMASPFDDREHARSFVDGFIAFLNDINNRREKIVPKYKVFRRISVPDILKILPQSNCGECGFTTCMAFAATLSRQQTVPGRCPYIGLPMNEQATYPVYDDENNLLSTITIDIDMAKSNAELKATKEYIDELEKKVSTLSGNQKISEKKANQSLPSSLTKREMEVLRLVASGATNTEISQILNISPHTVKSHIIHIFNKLGVNDRTQAAVWAAHHKLVQAFSF